MPLMSAPGRQKGSNFCEFEASLGYIVSSRSARGTELDTVQKKKKSLGKLLSSQTQEQLVYGLVTVFFFFFPLCGGCLN